MSIEEYLRREEQGAIKHEYHDGFIVAMCGGTVAHARIAVNVTRILDDQISGPCHAHKRDLKVKIDAHLVDPDASVSCEPADWDQNARFLRFPRLIGEVFSPSTAAYDRGEKFALSQKLPSLQAYVLMSSHSQIVEMFQRSSGTLWTYQMDTAENHRIPLGSLGLEFTMDQVYARLNIPKHMQISFEA